MALAIVPLMPFLGALRPFFRPEATLVTVAKAFLLLLKDPGLPKLFDFFTAAIPTLIALLNFEGFLFRVIAPAPTDSRAPSYRSGLTLHAISYEVNPSPSGFSIELA